MDSNALNYLKSLKPQAHRDGRELVREGVEMGKTISAGKGAFIGQSDTYKNHMEYKLDLARQGKIYWNILLGLATIDEQVAAIRELYDWSTRTGLDLHCIQMIASGLIALPKEYRDKAPATTSFVMDGLADYQALAYAAPIDITFNDYHLFSPNALETTINAVKVGSPRIGDFTQFYWGYAGFNDDVRRFSDVVTALGILASKRDEMICAETYLDDGYPGYFIDCASYVGYALLEHYICTKLCGARYVISFGGLLSENDTRCAIAMALHTLMSTPDQTVLTYLNSSTNLQWDHDIHGNYGVSVPEMLFEILVEKKYRMALGVNPVSITEKIKVPTLEDLENIFTAGKRAEEKAEEWLPFMDFSKLEEMRDVMVNEGKIFFNNVLDGFREAGIDVEDPLELFLVLKNCNPIRFEQMFHSSTYKKGTDQITPFYPTVLGRQTLEMREEIVAALHTDGLAGALDGKKIVVGSGDAHTYGLVLVEGVLAGMGADVINAGVDVDPVDILDLADEVGSRYIGISCHNGQALDYGRQLMALIKERKRDYWVFMGGKLNAILPGDSEPTEIAHMLEELGIHSENDIAAVVKKLGRQ
ncbi:MAG: cobalamin B12-binding domain-containing protein [Planctomycetes bacterium]|nr:cobalamin B12-binding domain-containing protein [Planctomycetota bacterium]